jgi:hypothetical protein
VVIDHDCTNWHEAGGAADDDLDVDGEDLGNTSWKSGKQRPDWLSTTYPRKLGVLKGCFGSWAGARGNTGYLLGVDSSIRFLRNQLSRWLPGSRLLPVRVGWRFRPWPKILSPVFAPRARGLDDVNQIGSASPPVYSLRAWVARFHFAGPPGIGAKQG